MHKSIRDLLRIASHRFSSSVFRGTTWARDCRAHLQSGTCANGHHMVEGFNTQYVKRGHECTQEARYCLSVKVAKSPFVDSWQTRQKRRGPLGECAMTNAQSPLGGAVHRQAYGQQGLIFTWSDNIWDNRHLNKDIQYNALGSSVSLDNISSLGLTQSHHGPIDKAENLFEPSIVFTSYRLSEGNNNDSQWESKKTFSSYYNQLLYNVFLVPD